MSLPVTGIYTIFAGAKPKLEQGVD